MTFMLDDGTELERLETDVFQGRTDPAYWNLIGPYGGWIAALMLKSVAQDAVDGFEPLVVTVEYLKAPKEGPIILRRSCDRAGRTAAFWRAQLELPDGTLCARAMITLAPHRDTLDFSDYRMPAVPSASSVEPFDTSLLPVKWPRCYDTRIVKGQMGQKNADTHSLFWIRDVDGRPLDHISLTAIADSPFPRLFLATGQASNISTISMTTYLHATSSELDEIGSELILADCRCERASGGFYDQHSRFYSPQGHLIATSQQMVWYDRAP